MLLRNLTKKLDECFGINFALKSDKVGLQIGASDWDIKNIMTAMEITPDVIEDAENKSCELIIVFHPLIYSPLSSLSDQELISGFAMRLIQSKIAVYVVHTALDTHQEGNNFHFAKKLGLTGLEFLKEDLDFKNNHHDLEIEQNDRGMGALGNFDGTYQDLVDEVHSITSSLPRYSDFPLNEKVKKIAILCGSGLSFATYSMERGADVLITADVSYHSFRAYGSMRIIDPGHWEMEQWSPQLMQKMLTIFFSNTDLVIFECGVRTNFAKQLIRSPKIL